MADARVKHVHGQHADIVFEYDSKAVAAALRGPTGEIYRNLTRVVTAIKEAAVDEAPRGRPDIFGRKPPPGNLQSRIVARYETRGTDSDLAMIGSVAAVGVPYAVYVHEGTIPHVIRPVRAKRLVFEAHPRAGASAELGTAAGAPQGVVVRARQVNHPGNEPNRFLIRAAIKVVGAGNVRGKGR